MTTDFLFDARDHIRQVLIGGSSVGQFLYDPYGLRIEKIGDRGVERYTYDDLSVLLQYNGDNNTVAKFDWGPDRLLSLNHITEGTQFYLTDVLGSVVNLTHRDGSIQARYQYDAWGNRRNQVGDSWNRFAFTGHEEDTETGLLYAKARFYDPDTGRFLSQDAYEGDINTPPSLHKYLYAYQNPTVYTDPDGNLAIAEGSAQNLREGADLIRQRGDELENNGLNVFTAFSYSLGAGLLDTLAFGTEVVNQAGNLAVDTIASDNSTSYFVRDARRDLAETRFELADAIESGARSYRAAQENPGAAISEVTSNVTRIVEDFASGDTGTITEFGAALIPAGAGVAKVAQVAGKAGKKSVDAVREGFKSRKARKQAQSNTSQISSNGSNVADGEFGIEGVDGGRVPNNGSLERSFLGSSEGHQFAGSVTPGGTGTAYAGHGKYVFGSGDVTVPNGSAVTLPREGITILDDTGRYIEAGDWDGLARAASQNPRIANDIEGMTTWLPGAKVPNYTLSAPTNPPLNILQNSSTVESGTTLDRLLQPNMGCVQWAACTEF